MQAAIDRYIQELETKLPSVCTDKDLLAANLASRPTLSRMRKASLGPAYFRIYRKKIAYLREDVLAWVRSIYFDNNINTTESMNGRKS